MFFKGKKNKIKCANCNSKVGSDFSYCPYCGNPTMSKEEEVKKFGLLGRNDAQDEFPQIMPNLGVMNGFLESIMNNMVKSLYKQMNELENDKSDENRIKINNMPNGIRIQIAGPAHKETKKQKEKIHRNTITQEQIERMSGLPRATAKTAVKRLNNKVIYELTTPGLQTADDVFISKLETGYEIKAIGDKKVYIKSIPINLPLKRFNIADGKLNIEFQTEGSAMQPQF